MSCHNRGAAGRVIRRLQLEQAPSTGARFHHLRSTYDGMVESGDVGAWSAGVLRSQRSVLGLDNQTDDRTVFALSVLAGAPMRSHDTCGACGRVLPASGVCGCGVVDTSIAIETGNSDKPLHPQQVAHLGTEMGKTWINRSGTVTHCRACGRFMSVQRGCRGCPGVLARRGVHNARRVLQWMRDHTHPQHAHATSIIAGLLSHPFADPSIITWTAGIASQVDLQRMMQAHPEIPTAIRQQLWREIHTPSSTATPPVPHVVQPDARPQHVTTPIAHPVHIVDGSDLTAGSSSQDPELDRTEHGQATNTDGRTEQYLTWDSDAMVQVDEIMDIEASHDDINYQSASIITDRLGDDPVFNNWVYHGMSDQDVEDEWEVVRQCETEGDVLDALFRRYKAMHPSCTDVEIYGRYFADYKKPEGNEFSPWEPDLSLDAYRDWKATWMVFHQLDIWGTGGSSIRMQCQWKAAEDEFHLEHAYRDYELHDRLTQFLQWNEDGVRRVLRAQYDLTQEDLQRRGITHVSLMRGIYQHCANAWTDQLADDRPNLITTQLRPLSSFTSDAKIAWDFATGADVQMVITANVPAERILSHAMIGQGWCDEHEWVVLGGDFDAAIIKSSQEMVNSKKRNNVAWVADFMRIDPKTGMDGNQPRQDSPTVLRPVRNRPVSNGVT